MFPPVCAVDSRCAGLVAGLWVACLVRCCAMCVAQVLRVFDAPSAFLSLLSTAGVGTVLPPGDTVARAERAYVPELGLSNKVRACSGLLWGIPFAATKILIIIIVAGVCFCACVRGAGVPCVLCSSTVSTSHPTPHFPRTHRLTHALTH